jgi:acetyl esterase/lipase
VNVEKDVVFGKVATRRPRSSICRPASTSKRTAIIPYHGGGFTGGSKDSLAAALGPMTSLGYVNIAAQYRLAGVAKWPSQITT